MKKGRRAFAIFMAMIMVIALLPTAAFAQDDGAVNNDETLGAETVTESVGTPETQEGDASDETGTDEDAAVADSEDVGGTSETDDSFGGFAGDDEFAVEPDDEVEVEEEELPTEDEEEVDILGEDVVAFLMERAVLTCKYTANWKEVTGGSTPIGKFEEVRGTVPTFGGADLTNGGKYKVIGYKVSWKEDGKTHSSNELRLPENYSTGTTVTVYVIDKAKKSAGITLDVKFEDADGNELEMPKDYAINYSGTIFCPVGDGLTFDINDALTAGDLVFWGQPKCVSRITFGEQTGLGIVGYNFVEKKAHEFGSTDCGVVYEADPFGSGIYVIGSTADSSVRGTLTITNYYEAMEGHKVTFEGIEEEQTVPHNGKATLPEDEPVKDGFRFDGWEFDFDTPIIEDTDIKAIWVEQVTHTWMTEKDGEIFATTTADKGAEATPPTKQPTRTGYEFDGWKTDENDSTVHIAQWKIKQLTVTWMNGETEVATTTVDYGATATAPETELVNDGYRLGGWTVEGEDGAQVDFDLKTTITEDITLSAKWIKQVTHVWNAPEADEDALKSRTTTADEGAEATPPSTDPTRAGYTFTGWSDGEYNEEMDAIVHTAQWRANSSGGGGTGGGGTGGGSTGGDNTGDNTGGDNTGGNGGETIGGGEGGEGNDPADENDPNGENGGLVDIDDEGTALGDRPFTFIDVTKNDWFYDAVYAVWEKELMNGTTATTFEPQTMTTRGMLVTILYRMEGSPEVVSPNSFSDVAEDMYYAKAVAWAAENGIVTGYDDETFGPEDVLLREQTAAILYRYAKYKGMDVATDGALEFDDADMIGDYAQDAMLWAVSVGLINGVDENTLAPKDGTQRSHMATLLTRLVAMVEPEGDTTTDTTDGENVESEPKA